MNLLYMFSTLNIFFREIPLNNSRAIFTRPCCFVQTCLHQVLLYLDKPIVQYNCQTCLLKNKHLTRTCTQKITTSKGGDFVSPAILRCGYICRSTLEEVQLVPGIINFICAVSSQLQVAPHSCWVVKVSHRFTFASGWFCRDTAIIMLSLHFLVSLQIFVCQELSKLQCSTSQHTKDEEKKTGTFTILMWCHDDV